MDNETNLPAQTPIVPKPKPYLKWLVLVVALLIIAALAFVAWKTDKPKPGKWQAVFLDNNNAVYFGHLDGDTLKDVYYVQSLPAQGTSTEAQLSLVKRGGELHQPDGTIMLNPQHVLFVENLNPGGSVAKQLDTAQKQ